MSGSVGLSGDSVIGNGCKCGVDAQRDGLDVVDWLPVIEGMQSESSASEAVYLWNLDSY